MDPLVAPRAIIVPGSGNDPQRVLRGEYRRPAGEPPLPDLSGPVKLPAIQIASERRTHESLAGTSLW